MTPTMEPLMRVDDVMTAEVRTCGPTEPLDHAAQVMWENDCGVVPVVHEDGTVVGMVTDRDICMAAYTQGRPLAHLPVSTAMSAQLHTVPTGADIHAAEAVMQRHQIRRVPVVDEAGRLAGLVSLNDLACAISPKEGRSKKGEIPGLVQTLSAVCAPRA